MAWVLGETVSESFTLQSLATGQTFTRVASQVDGVNTTWSPSSFPEIGGGSYRYVYAPSTAGRYWWVGDADNGERLTISFTVIPAAADPAAIATAIADLFDQPVSDFTNSNTLGGRIKMVTAGTRS